MTSIDYDKEKCLSISGQEREMNYILFKFLKDVKNKVKPLMIPSLEFIYANFQSDEQLYEANSEGDLFLTVQGELIMNRVAESLIFNKSDVQITNIDLP